MFFPVLLKVLSVVYMDRNALSEFTNPTRLHWESDTMCLYKSSVASTKAFTNLICQSWQNFQAFV